MTNFAELFNRQVEYLGVTNQKLAMIMGVHHTTVARWRKGPKSGEKFNEAPIKRFADHYRLTVGESHDLLAAAGFASGQIVSGHINPFIAGQPVRHGHFFGREEVLEDLFNLWKAFPNMPIQNAAIWGERRIGKTSLLLHLKDIATANSTETRLRNGQKTDWLPNPENYSWIFVDFQDARVCSQKRFLEYVLKNMKLEESDDAALSLSNDNPLSEFSDLVSRCLKKPAIILLDEIDFALEQCPQELDNAFWEGLRALSTTMLESQCLGFVLASRRHPVELGELGKGNASPVFNIFGHVIELKEFTEEQARALIDSSPEAFPEDDIQFMLKKSECKPHLLQILCRMCFDQQIKGENGNVWRQKAEESINRMKSSKNQGKSSSSIGNGKNSK